MQKVFKAQQAMIGQRLKKAMDEAGLTGYQLAKRLHVHFPTVYRWLRGERTPTPVLLQACAELLDKPITYFYEQEGENDRPEELADLLLSWAQRLMAGEEPGAAFDQATGDPAALSRRERQQLAAAAPHLRADLTAAAGGNWTQLSADEQRQILDQVAELAARRHVAERSS